MKAKYFLAFHFFVILLLILSTSCQKRRVTKFGNQSNASTAPNNEDPSVQDPPGGVCEGGLHVSIVPSGQQRNFTVGRNVLFDIIATGCRHGYGVNLGGRFLRFNPRMTLSVRMPESPQVSYQENFSIVAFNAQGSVHRGPFNFSSDPFQVSQATPDLLPTVSFLPSQTISVENRSIRVSLLANQNFQIQRVFSDEANYVASVNPSGPFDLVAHQPREVLIQLNRGEGGNDGMIKFEFGVAGSPQVAQLAINHNVCRNSYQDDFFGTGSDQALTYQCADGAIRIPWNLSGSLVSFWRAPSDHRVKDLMHGKIDRDAAADLLFFTQKNGEPQKAYFFFGKSRPSTLSNTVGGNFDQVIACSGAWEAPPGTSIPNQFFLELSQGELGPRLTSVHSNGVRYQAFLSVSESSCSIGPVQITPPSTALAVSKQTVNPGESFEVVWSASNVAGYQCRLEKKAVAAANWELVGAIQSPGPSTGAASIVAERRESQAIQVSTQYRAVCSQSAGGTATQVGDQDIRTVNVNSCPSGSYLSASGCRPFAVRVVNRALNSRASTWQNSGVTLTEQTQNLAVTATGTVSLQPRTPRRTAAGYAGNGFARCRLNRSVSLPGGAVLGKIGTNPPFVIGTQLTEQEWNRIKNQRGALMLLVNDPGCAGDNSGSFQITATHTFRE